MKHNYSILLFTSVFLMLSFVGISQTDLNIQLIPGSAELPPLHSMAQADISIGGVMAQINVNRFDPSAEYMLEMIIEGEDVAMTSRMRLDRYLASGTKGTATLFQSDMSDLLDPGQMNLRGITLERLQKFGLKPGSYRMCLQVYDVALDRLQRISNSSCQLFIVKHTNRPVIDRPSPDDVIYARLPYQMTWSMNDMRFLASEFEVLVYQDVSGISDQDLIQYYQPIWSTNVRQTNVILAPADMIVLENQQLRVFVRHKHAHGIRNPNQWSEGVSFAITSSGMTRSSNCTIGAPCDDGDPCTLYDTYDANCDCVGTPDIGTYDIHIDPVYSVSLTHRECCICADHAHPDANDMTFMSLSFSDRYGVYRDLSRPEHGLGIMNFPYAWSDSYPMLEDLAAWFDATGHKVEEIYTGQECYPAGQSQNIDRYVTILEFRESNFGGGPSGRVTLSVLTDNGYEHDFIFSSVPGSEPTSQIGYWISTDPDLGTSSSQGCYVSGTHSDLHWEPSEPTAPYHHGAFVEQVDDCHYIEVTCPNGCSAQLSVTGQPCGCTVVGQPCDDQDDCTVNDTYDENCSCVGEEPDIVELEVEEILTNAYYSSLSYASPCDPGIQVVGISFHDEFGRQHYVNSVNDCPHVQGFPYLLPDENNRFLYEIGKIVVSCYDKPSGCTPLGIPIPGTVACSDIPIGGVSTLMLDLTMFSYGIEYLDITDGTGANIQLPFINSLQYSMSSGYSLGPTPELQEHCSSLTINYPEGDWVEDPATNSIIFCEEPCFDCMCMGVEVICDDCTYDYIHQSNTGCQNCGASGDCSCVIGAPCFPANGGLQCVDYVYDEDCNCVPTGGSTGADSDGDGVCDLDDVCPGHDDHLDEDEDGVPDGCDLCECYPDGELTQMQIDLLMDNDPSNDPDICGMGTYISVENSELTPLQLNLSNGSSVSFFETDCGDPSTLNDFYLRVAGAVPTGESIQTMDYLLGGVPMTHDLAGYVNIESEDFESGLGAWTISPINGTIDFCEYVDDPAQSPSVLNSSCVLLRKNGNYSRLISPSLDLQGVSSVRVDFKFVTEEFEGSEDFFLQVSTNGGSSYTNVRRWIRGVHFFNGTLMDASKIVNRVFSSNTKFRIQCSANGAEDYLYIDDIKIFKNVIGPDNYQDAASLIDVFYQDQGYDGSVSYSEQTSVCGYCGCDDEIIPYVQDETNASCDYCAEVSTLSNVDPQEHHFFAQYKTEDENGMVTTDLLEDWFVLNQESFESGLGDWKLNAVTGQYGQHWGEHLLDATKAPGGIGCVLLRARGGRSIVTLSNLDLSQACLTKVSFDFIAKSFDSSNEDFFLQIHDGGGWSNIKRWREGIDFENGEFHHEEVIIAGNLGSNTKVRFRCDASGNGYKDSLFLDNFNISVLEGINGDCYPVNDISGFVTKLNDDIINRGEQGQASHQVGLPPSSTCGEGDFIRISNATERWISFEVTGASTTRSYAFNSPDCPSSLPGQPMHRLAINANCPDASYLWSTGETTSSIVVPNPDAGYSVTIDCGDCSYTEQFGDPNCMVGAPCQTGDVCYPTGYIDTDCNCTPDVNAAIDSDGDGEPDNCDPCPDIPNDLDSDGDGITDCAQSTCDCQPEDPMFIQEITKEGYACSACLELLAPLSSDLLTKVLIVADGIEFTLEEGTPGFDFPYCTLNDFSATCDDEYPGIYEFRTDLIVWAYNQGWEVQVIDQPVADQCEYGLDLRNFPCDFAVVTYFNNGDEFIQKSYGDPVPFPKYNEYRLVLSNPTCDGCQDGFTIDWNHPDIPDGTTIIDPYIPGGGYEVTMTCNDPGSICAIKVIHPGDCLVGDTCTDANLVR